MGSGSGSGSTVGSTTPPAGEGREALVEAVLLELSRVGPANIRPNDVSQSLGLSKSLVNFHFGNRDGLIAEAMVVGYERYVDDLWRAAESAGERSLDRLRAWIDRQIEWTIEHPGLAATLNFPAESAALDRVANPDVRRRLESAGERNFSNLQELVRAAGRDIRGGTEPGESRIGLDAAVIGWLTLGASVWASGRHLPSRGLGLGAHLGRAQDHLHDNVIAVLSRRPNV